MTQSSDIVEEMKAIPDCTVPSAGARPTMVSEKSESNTESHTKFNVRVPDPSTST